jgi:hypothetical protein
MITTANGWLRSRDMAITDLVPRGIVGFGSMHGADYRKCRSPSNYEYWISSMFRIIQLLAVQDRNIASG